MKYCPYCGAELLDKAASFCTECGNRIFAEKTTETAVAQKMKKNRKRKHSKAAFEKRKAELLAAEEPPAQPEPAEDYDGYYSDVIPSDLDREREGLDKDLIGKIAVVAGAMLLIIGLCVAAMYLL